MAKLVFEAADVRRVVEHSIANKQSSYVADYDKNFNPITKMVDRPAVLLVKDHGVYLMSNGEPRDIVSGESSFVAYAKGCHPEKDEDCWERSRELAGGDDFGETLQWAEQIKALLDRGAKKIVINLGKTKISLGAA